MVSGRIPDLNNKYDSLHSYHGVHWGWGALAVAASPRGTGFVPEAGWWSWVVLNRSTLWDAACCSGDKPSCLTSWFGRPIPLAAGEGTIWAAAGVVDVTPANKAKRSVSWVSSEGATTGWASTCGESCTQAADGDEGEYYSAADEGLPRQGLWYLAAEARACLPGTQEDPAWQPRELDHPRMLLATLNVRRRISRCFGRSIQNAGRCRWVQDAIIRSTPY